MANPERTLASLFETLRERAKELNCLYTIEELASDSNAPLEEILNGVIAAIPPGWQYPDICRARITFDGSVYQSPGFKDTPWRQRAPLIVYGEPEGTLEVVYLEHMPQADEGPFLKEERRLIDTIADRVGNAVTHRRLIDALRDWRLAQKDFAQRTTHEWQVILDLLRRTDQALLMRVTRKMLNHLCWSGVKEADALLRHGGVGSRVAHQEALLESNRPADKKDLPTIEALVNKVFSVAENNLSSEEIVDNIHKWIKQDRASFLVNALENYHTSLSEVGDALHRYQHSTHGEVELSSSTRKGLRVSLVRRFLTDQLEYINVAKNYSDIRDFHELMQHMIFPSKGHGKLGGKSAGLFLAGQILKFFGRDNDLLASVKIPKSWYLTSDGLHDFVYCNHLEDVFTQKYKDVDEVRQEYPDIVQVFKHSQFSTDIIKGLSLALDDFGDCPIIVRSSSLLEDRFGAAFSGKYKSLFLANTGTKRERLGALMDAIAEVYASTFSPDPVQYRAERGLIDFQEGMGVMIQEVVGRRIGDYYLPAFAGVAFTHNEFRWSPRIKREDGLVRMVPGLGTRAVDRLGDDYPVLVSPGQPGLRANATPEEIARYAPRYLDVINLRTGHFETIETAQFLRECGPQMPAIERFVSVFQQGHLRQPLVGQLDFENDDLVYTFEGLLSRTPFIKQVQAMLEALGRELGSPVDIEFAHDGQDLYLLQCRTQTATQHAGPAPIPRDLPAQRVVFTANRYVSNGLVPDVTHLVYVSPEAYSALGSLDELNSVGRAVSRLNKLLPKRQFVLMGPGRWGSRGDIKLGVRVTYSDINNTAMLIEIARRKGDYTPDLSFGTHFFQDLVEASIRYLPLYPDDDGVLFNEPFLEHSPNILAHIAPEFAHLSDVIRVIDVPQSADGHVLRVLMNADIDEAVGVLAQPAETLDSVDDLDLVSGTIKSQDWRWRLRMAERIAEQVDAQRFGVAGFYVFGSTKNGTAGPASDIDLLIHFRGTPEQRRELENWLQGWSLCLAEVNFLRTGYRSDGLLDVHIVTDEDIANRTSYAVKIDAVTDAARKLPVGGGLAPRAEVEEVRTS